LEKHLDPTPNEIDQQNSNIEMDDPSTQENLPTEEVPPQENVTEEPEEDENED